MTRLILLVALAFAVWSYFPETRRILLDLAQPIIVPAIKWEAREEMAQVGRNVLQHERLTGQLPRRREWRDWLDYRYPSDELKMDPWGNVYELRVWADSIAIESWGPDRTRGTEDDFRVVQPRQRLRRR